MIKKYFSPIFLLVSFFIFTYVIFKSEIYWDGSKRDFYKTYFLISFILIIAAIISFYLNQRIKLYLLIVSSSVTLTLYLFEAYQILNKSNNQISLKKELYKTQTGNEFDDRSKVEFYFERKKTNGDIVLTVGPSLYLDKKDKKLFPLSGISNANTIFCNESGQYVEYESDRYGFNNPDSEWDNSEIEFIVLGDSFAHGECVNRPHDISSVLRKLSNKNVLNLAYGGNGPLIEYATLREYLINDVKKILFFYYEENDLSDLKNEIKSKHLNKYIENLEHSQNLKDKQNIVNNIAREMIDNQSYRNIKKINSNKEKIINFLKLYNTRNLIYPEPRLKPDENFLEIVLLINKFAKKNNAQLYFIYLPEFARYKYYYNNQNYNKIKSIIENQQIPFIDIHREVFLKEKNPLDLFPFKLNGHYNIEGYRKIAKVIYKLTKND
tara:strand:+ start:867 stop:2177 length:1311 start_codon:yes stop_codon:yes gene_type:complete